jgi:hypothetical protein
MASIPQNSLRKESPMKERSEGTFRLRLRSYSGMTIDLIDEDDLAACRHRAARRIRRHRNRYEYPVTVLEPGRRWELESDPEGRHLISDGEGILAIEEVLDPCEAEEADDE